MMEVALFRKSMCTAMARPPWTFVNLALYALAPVAVVRRAAYVSMWATMICFESMLLLEPAAHVAMRRKNGLGVVAFYAGDVLVHWLPLLLYVPPLPWANLLGLAGNIAWGVCMTRGTMDLSEVYVPLHVTSWKVLWMISVVAHLSVRF